MPVLRKIVATPNTDSPMYQKNIGSRQVECGVDERVSVAVLLAAHVSEVDSLVLREQRAGLRVERSQMVLLHLPATRDLFDHQLRVAPHPHRARGCGRGGLESRDQRAVLGHV